MAFFDPKEDVLDIKITQYGRHLLSRGVWKPAYYAFFDENVLYDSQHGGFEESTASAEGRIQDETMLLKTQHSFIGREQYLFDGTGDILDRVQLGAYDKLTTLPYHLGTTSLESTKSPAFKIQFLEGTIDDLENTMTGTLRDVTFAADTTTYSQQLLNIPQIESDIEFKISVEQPAGEKVKFESDPALTPGRRYADGNTVVVGPSQILLLVEEKNAPFNYENFDIEVYEIADATGSFGEEILTPLSFLKPLEMVENNLLITPSEAAKNAGRVRGTVPELDPTFVEYYFNINVDSEIDENIICKAVSKLKTEDLYADINIDCPDLKDLVRLNIYSSDAIDEYCPDF